MAIMDDRFEHDVMKLWQLVVDLSEQISTTKQVANTLHNESIKLKVSIPSHAVCLSLNDMLSGSSPAHRNRFCLSEVSMSSPHPSRSFNMPFRFNTHLSQGELASIQKAFSVAHGSRGI